jgi:hypothetical protein
MYLNEDKIQSFFNFNGMKFQLTDGLGLVSIRLSEIGSYFRYTRPLSLAWNDCRGSIGKYFSLLPSDPAYREEIKQRIIGGLTGDYSDRIAELKQLLDPLLKLFPNGEYALTFYNEGDYFKIYLNDVLHNQNWYLLNSEPVEKQYASKLKTEYQKMTRRQRSGELDLLDYTTGNFYSGVDVYFIPTEDATSINSKRIKYFEEKIRAGERPFPIIFQSDFSPIIDDGDTSYYYESLYSDDYVLDGHHKLLAYANLKIPPPLALITHYPKTRTEAMFDIEELKRVLYPWQADHIADNWEEGYLYR